MDRLKELQALPLERKVGFTAARIAEFYNAMKGKVVVSFSGGKDSTVLLYLVRKLFPDVRAVFADTGLEFPEIRDFVKTWDNVDWVKPTMPFNQVIKKHGYPVISKDVAQRIWEYRQNHDGVSACYLGFKKWTDDNCHYKKASQTYEKYAYMVEAPFKISHKCCYELKKKPLHKYQRQNKLFPFIATLAEESFRRKNNMGDVRMQRNHRR
jgi:3'-phosphoadenosine 5'-phosphosulfate sulfotransferase (PAPS reductase)/FAD synthetase